MYLKIIRKKWDGSYETPFCKNTIVVYDLISIVYCYVGIVYP